jgi:signal transduction histidine kinase
MARETGTEQRGANPSARRGWRVRLLPGGIRGRLFLLITLTLLPVLSLLASVYYQRYATGRDQALQQELEAAQGVATTFAAYLDGVQEQLHTVGQGLLTYSPYDEVQAGRVLQALLARYTTIRGLHWLSPGGVVLGSSVPGVVGLEVSSYPYFRQIQAGAPRVVDDLTPQGVRADEPAFIVAVAIRDSGGELRGVMAASIDPLRLGTLTLTQQRSAGGEYMIFDRQRVLVYRSPEIPLTWGQRRQAGRGDALLGAALGGQTALGEAKSAILGDRCFAARAPIEDTGWVAGTDRSVDLALGPVRQGARQDAILAGLATALAFVSAYLLARTIAEPLRRLERDAGAVRNGRTEMTTGTEALIEVRHLRHTVAHMAMDLIQRAEALRAGERRYRELSQSLESKVAQRTAELKRRAKQLQRLMLDLSEAEDRERGRIAEILHDDLQQQLAGAKFHVGLLKNRVQQEPSLEALAAEIDRQLKDAVRKSRSLSHELCPAALHGDDIVEALRWLANDIQGKLGLVVHIRTPEEVLLPSDALKNFLYKAARELLFNIVKHAGVAEAEIRVRRCRRYICLSISDRGRGIDPQELQKTTGSGLLSIRERSELLGGRMKIRSANGQGSTFYVVVPDHAEPEDGTRMSAELLAAVGAGESDS